MKKSNKRVQLIPYDKSIYDQHIQMDEYWFDALLKKNCRFVGQYNVKPEKNLMAKIYSVDAEKSVEGDEKAKEPATFCFFILFQGKLWKEGSLRDVNHLLQVLERNENYIAYNRELDAKEEQAKLARKPKAKVKPIRKVKRAA